MCTFELGETVAIKDSQLTGIICNKRKSKNIFNYTVLINNNKLMINEDKLTKIPQKKSLTKTENININYVVTENINFKNEIMLRHLTTDEALYNLEHFISTALYNKIFVIKIIHGKNGGILRKAVHEFLNTNKNVIEYRLGNYYEGSYGVTIAKIKA